MNFAYQLQGSDELQYSNVLISLSWRTLEDFSSALIVKVQSNVDIMNVLTNSTVKKHHSKCCSVI